MLLYKFMDREVLKKRNIQDHVCKRYGLPKKIALDKAFFLDNLKKIFERKLENAGISELEDLLYEEDKETEEGRYLQKHIPSITKKLSQLETYSRDAQVDVFMGLLRADAFFDIKDNAELIARWKQKDCYKKINEGNAKKHYPYAESGNFENDVIPGGCKDYHELLISQNNLGLFDFSEKTRSLQRFAFPKTYEIYNSLKDTPIENLLLLEATQGINYANQLFNYMKGIDKKSDFDKLEDVIKIGVDISPMMIRKEITDIIWRFMEYFDYSSQSIKLAEIVLGSIVYCVNAVYKEILEYIWYMRFKSPENDLLSWRTSLEAFWREYFSDDEVYREWIRCAGIHDWRGIENVNDCFAYYEKSECSPLQEIYSTDLWVLKRIDGTELQLRLKRPINEIGSMVRNKTVEKMEKEVEIPTDMECAEKLFYEKERKIFEELKEKERIRIEDADPKADAERLKPVHIYAKLRKKIAYCLNKN